MLHNICDNCDNIFQLSHITLRIINEIMEKNSNFFKHFPSVVS